jgi:protease-4
MKINKEKIKNFFEKIIAITKFTFRILPTIFLIFIFFSFISSIDILLGGDLRKTPIKEVIEFNKQAPEIAVVDLTGIITGGDFGNLDSTNAQSFIKLLDYLKKDINTLGVIININSPGGEAVSSDIIANKIRELKKTKKVVSYIREVGASGAYMIASLSHKIISHPQSIVGSIGAKIDIPIVKELSDKVGFKIETIKSGQFKDIASPFKELSLTEQKMLQNLVNQSFESFVGIVAEGRKLSLQEVKAVADGRVISGVDAKEINLVDDVGMFEDAQKIMEQLVGSTPLSYYKYYFRQSPIEKILSILGGNFNIFQSLKVNLTKKLLYLWE